MDIENLTYSIFIKAYEDLKAEPPKIEPIMIQKIQFKRDKIKEVNEK